MKIKFRAVIGPMTSKNRITLTVPNEVAVGLLDLFLDKKAERDVATGHIDTSVIAALELPGYEKAEAGA